MKKHIILLLIFMSARIYSQNCEYLCNGNFDKYFVTGSVGLVDTLSCWKTTASDGKMEVWGSNFNNVPSFNGIQHVELNATEAATMYQDFSISAGATLSISFAHRGRAGNDTMEALVGPAGGPYVSLGYFGDNNLAWGSYTVNYTTLSSGIHRIMFKPVYATGNNPAIGNFLDAVSVKGMLQLTVTASSSVVCAGSALTLSVAGAMNYTWTSGPQTAAFSLTPVSSAIYTVTGDNGNNCPATNTILVNVNPLPNVTASASPAKICRFAAPAILSASGAVTYQWLGAANSPTIHSGTGATTTYTVVGTDANGCSNTATALVTVEICEGVGELMNANAFKIYPNPTTSNLYIVSSLEVKLVLLNEAGQILRTLHLSAENDYCESVSGLPKGIYLLKTNDGEVLVRRVIVGDN